MNTLARFDAVIKALDVIDAGVERIKSKLNEQCGTNEPAPVAYNTESQPLVNRLWEDSERLRKALLVFLLTKADVTDLLIHDPKGVEQAMRALDTWARHNVGATVTE